MKLEYLKEFLILSTTLNFNEAAEKLYISPSSLSRHIAQLEKEVGAPLFERDSRNVCLSRAGALLIPYAREAADARERYRAELREVCASSRKIVIGFARCIVEYGLLDRLIDFRQNNPDLSVILSETNPRNMATMLADGECDLSIGYDYGLYDSEFELVPLLRDTMAAVLPASHRLAGRDSVELRMLKDEFFIMRQRSGTANAQAVSMCHRAGFEPNVIMNVENGAFSMELVSRGVGIAVIEKNRFASRAPAGVKVLDLLPTVEKNVTVAYRRFGMNDAKKRLLNYLMMQEMQ